MPGVPRGRQVSRLPPCSACLKHHCSQADSVPCSPVFPASPQAAAEPSLMESTLLAAVIPINATLLALAITCQCLTAFQLETSCQQLQLMSRTGGQICSTFIHGRSEGWMPSLPETPVCPEHGSGTGTGTRRARRALATRELQMSALAPLQTIN